MKAFKANSVNTDHRPERRLCFWLGYWFAVCPARPGVAVGPIGSSRPHLCDAGSHYESVPNFWKCNFTFVYGSIFRFSRSSGSDWRATLVVVFVAVNGSDQHQWRGQQDQYIGRGKHLLRFDLFQLNSLCWVTYFIGKGIRYQNKWRHYPQRRQNIERTIENNNQTNPNGLVLSRRRRLQKSGTVGGYFHLALRLFARGVYSRYHR